MALPGNFAELYLTDGTALINLLSRQNGFALQEWQPLAPAAKGGGVWQDSPLAAGRRLVARHFENVLEDFTLAGRGGLPDLLIQISQDVRRLLEKAVAFWITDWQSTPVYLIARGAGETNTRYALLFDYRAPGDGNPFHSPFTGPDAAIYQEWHLILERSNWQDKPPGQSTCVEISGTGVFAPLAEYQPAGTTDDAYVNGSAIVTGSTSLFFGTVGTAVYDAGMRFIGVDIPQAATILKAFIRMTSVGLLNTSTPVHTLIYGEDVDSAAAFSTFANFNARTRTTANVAYAVTGAWVDGQVYVTDDLSPIVQEIVDRGGWVLGNDLVIFIEDNSEEFGTENVFRQFAALDHASYTPPTLVIVYEQTNVGRAATCTDEVYIANKQNRANLTHLFHYDDSTTTFSSNLLNAALPYALLPAAPGVDDILYLICNTDLTDSGPFNSAVWDIGDIQVDITGVDFEYWNGATWAALTVTDNTATDSAPFSVTGVNSWHWNQPSDWATTVVNGVTGYAIRMLITSLGAAPEPPTQQNRQPYSVTWPYVELAASQIKGDLTALAQALVLNQADGTQIDGITVNINRVLVGLRSVSRGELFQPFLNIADEQNQSGVTVAVGTNTTFTADTTAVTGRNAVYNPTGAESMATRVSVALNNTLTGHYYGRFRLFVRCRQVAGSAGDIQTQVLVCLNSANVVVYTSPLVPTPTVTASASGEWTLLDYGQIELPPQIGVLKSTDTFNQFLFLLQANAASGTPNLWYQDMILFPIDESACDTQGIANIDAMLGYFSANRQLEIDSVERLRSPLTAVLTEVYSNNFLNFYTPIAPAPFQLQANTRQRLYFLADNRSALVSWTAAAFRIRLNAVARYQTMRGAR